jgi:transposase
MPHGVYDDPKLIEAAKEAMRESKDPHQIKRAQSILLSHYSTFTLPQIADLLQTSEISIARWRKEFWLFYTQGLDRRQNWGGFRRQNLTDAEEDVLLAALEATALKGGILTVGPIQDAYEKKLGRPVRRSVIYFMLKRHGWRKVVPRQKHPKEDEALQQEWKKKLSTGSSPNQKLWLPPKAATSG